MFGGPARIFPRLASKRGREPGAPGTRLKDSHYDNVSIEAVVSTKEVVNVKEHYDTERLRPLYKSFQMKPLFIMASMG